MKAVELICTRIVYSESAFEELKLGHLPMPVEGSLHMVKYRLAYVVSGKCVLRYDNESRKGDHRHYTVEERAYAFTTPEQLIADFQNDIARWQCLTPFHHTGELYHALNHSIKPNERRGQAAGARRNLG